jgi:PAS domain S-box-containing protein
METSMLTENCDGKSELVKLSLLEREIVDDLLLFLAQTSSGVADEPFFNSLARFLAQSLDMDFICIDRLEGDGLTARTLAVWCDGHFEDNVTYALKDTPCGDVVGKDVCCFPASVCQFFPRDEVLVDLRAESYVGVTLWGRSGRPIGLIAVIGRGPLANPALAERLLKLVAVRAAAELERLEAMLALENSERFLKTIIDTEPECVKLLDSDGNLLMMNRAGLEMIGADSFEQVKGQCVCPLITEPYRDAFMALTKQVFQGIPGTLVFETIGLKGRHVWLETHAVPFRNEHGEISALLGITRNVTEQKKLEEERVVLEKQLQQSQRLESLGVLAGGIAHDFNNILQIIMGGCSLVKMNSGDSKNYIQQMEIAIERAAELTRKMLAYAGKAPLDNTRVDMVELVDKMVTLLKSSIHQNVLLKTDLLADTPPVIGDASHIGQIVMSLINNSAEAIGEASGEIRVSLSKIQFSPAGQDKDHLGRTIPAGWYVCLEVTDNGCGMDDEAKSRIFEPFYTSKFMGRGLGMSAVLGLITAHGGTLQLRSQPGHGTTIKVYLPVQISDSAGDKFVQQAPSTEWRGCGTVLLVEDEHFIRTIASDMLKVLGFTVIEAANGKEALELYRKNATDTTLVMTDIGMPVMDGYELFRELKQLRPELPIIIASGFNDEIVTSRIPREEIAGLMAKPFNFDQLREILKSVVWGKSIQHS